MTLDKNTYEQLYVGLNDIKDAVDAGHTTKASVLTDILINEVRYANVK